MRNADQATNLKLKKIYIKCYTLKCFMSNYIQQNVLSRHPCGSNLRQKRKLYRLGLQTSVMDACDNLKMGSEISRASSLLEGYEIKNQE